MAENIYKKGCKTNPVKPGERLKVEMESANDFILYIELVSVEGNILKKSNQYILKGDKVFYISIPANL